MSDGKPQAVGVQRLLDRLREEGVEAGRQEAEALRAKAESEAEEIVARAKAESERLVEAARVEAEQLRTAGEEALRSATRDTVLQFSDEIMEHLRNRVERLVSEEMVDRRLLQQLILQVAARAVDVPAVEDADSLRVELPTEPLGIEELKDDPDALKDELSALVKQVAGATWREGVRFGSSSEGIRVSVEDGGVEIDLSPQAVTELLMQHLRPRFRALMRGIIQ